MARITRHNVAAISKYSSSICMLRTVARSNMKPKDGFGTQAVVPRMFGTLTFEAKNGTTAPR